MGKARGAIQCRGTTKQNTPCQNYALEGGLVCRMHGGAAPQVRRKAKARLEDAERLIRERLLELREPAVQALESILRDDMGNAKPSDQIRAAEVVLDRLIPKKVEAKVDTVDSEERDLDAEIAGTLGIELNVPHEEQEAG